LRSFLKHGDGVGAIQAPSRFEHITLDRCIEFHKRKCRINLDPYLVAFLEFPADLTPRPR